MPTKILDIDLPEEQSINPDSIALEKARIAYERVQSPLIVDDSALMIDALGGFPGALVRWALKADPQARILHRMLPPGAPASARAVTAIALATDAGCQIFRGEVPGKLLPEPRGIQGFGYDPVFLPEGREITFAEMEVSEKDIASPRGIALAQLRDHLIMNPI